MRRLNLPLVLDTFFCGLCAFLLFFTAIRYYTRNAVLALCFALVAAALFGTLGYLIISRKQKAKLLLSRDEKNKKLLSLHLSLSSDDDVKKLLKSCIGEEARISGNRILCGDCVYFTDFKMHPLSEDDVAAVIKRKGEKKILFCSQISPEAAALAQNFLIDVRTIDNLYSALKEKDLLPEKYVFQGAPKAGVFKKIKARFTRKLCAPLFWSGAALLALSYFTFYPVYYIVSGSVLLFLSAVALVVRNP